MKILFLSLLCLISAFLFAQDNNAIKQQLIKDWERAKAYTQEYLDAMPADKYDYRPVDSIRSFAEQMLHLAQGNAGLTSNGTGAPQIFVGQNLERSATAKTKDSVVHYVNASYDFAINSLKNMDAAKLSEMVKRGNLNASGTAWIMKAFEHQTHHRGQCTIYIRLLGIRPPAEKLF